MKKISHQEINSNSFTYKTFLNQKYRSLKHSNFFYVYDEIFKKFFGKKITLVEVGVTNGGSLFMWKEIFGNDARIIGIDFNPSAKRWEKYGFEIYIGNQSDNNFWEKFYSNVDNIDILIDDGGHTNDQQIVTLGETNDKINDDGVLIFEDTHSSYMKEFGNPSKYSFINFCFQLANIQNEKILEKENLYKYSEKIHKIEFYQCMVVFHFNKHKAEKSLVLDNGGEVLNSEDYRLKDAKVFTFIDKIKKNLREKISLRNYNYLKKIYPYFKFLVFKFKNLKDKKFFKKKF